MSKTPRIVALLGLGAAIAMTGCSTTAQRDFSRSVGPGFSTNGPSLASGDSLAAATLASGGFDIPGNTLMAAVRLEQNAATTGSIRVSATPERALTAVSID